MFLNFAAALATLGEGAAYRVANEARPAAEYVFATLLPERNRPTYSVDSGSMTVRPTMAGLVGMDSPYPPGGMVEMSTFLERTAKLANEVSLSEQALRELQELLLRTGRGGSASPEVLAREALNFLDKVVLQAHLDAMEWLRGQALVNGAINWTYNQKNLTVDYGIPATHMLATRTGTDAYGGTSSKFWEDVTLLRRRLKGDVRAIVAHPETVDEIRYNPANSLVTIQADAGGVTFRRVNAQGNFTQDTGDIIRLVSYGLEGEVINPADPSTTLVVPFMPRGKLLAVGNNRASGYMVGQGATESPDESNTLGYTHIAPTVEGGAPGRWADLRTPDDRPWQLRGRGVTNGLPVIEAYTKVAVATTEMP